ncbi:MAG: septal ring lytic transglycosylase RlpA family protein [Comamonas sp.]
MHTGRGRLLPVLLLALGTGTLAPGQAQVSGPAASSVQAGNKTAELLRQANAHLAQQAHASAGAAQQKDAPTLQAALQRGLHGARQRGMASWYADSLHGGLTANGERYDRNELTAAHQTLPLGTWVKVSRVGSPRSVLVRINDRGPFAKSRIIDLSYQAAKSLGIIRKGTAQVEMEVVAGPGETPQQMAVAN